MRRGPGRRHPNAADQAAEVERIKRRKSSVELRIHSGLSYRQIGERTGVSEAQAMVDVKRGIAELPKEDADVRKARACQAIDSIVRVHKRLAVRGDDKSANVVLKALALDSEISGYRAPDKHEHAGPGGGPIAMVDVTKLSDAELQQLATGDPSPGRDRAPTPTANERSDDVRPEGDASLDEPEAPPTDS